MNKQQHILMLFCAFFLVSIMPVDAAETPEYLISHFASVKKLAETGNANAQFDLASLYDEGKEVKQDFVQAAIWYTKAAKQGDVASQYNLSIMYDLGEGVTQNIVMAYAWIATAELYGFKGARESSRTYLSRLTPEQKEAGDKLVIEITNEINKVDETALMPQ